MPASLTGASAAGNGPVAAVLEQIDLARRMIAAYPARLGLALTADDVERIFASGRVASLLGAEGGHAIAGSLGVLRMLYALGVRYLTLTHNANVGWADSATDVTIGLEDVATYPALFAELLRRGWTEPDCAALAGGNLLRVLRSAESYAGPAAR